MAVFSSFMRAEMPSFAIISRSIHVGVMQPPALRSFVPQEPDSEVGEGNFVAPQQRSFTPVPRQMEQPNVSFSRIRERS
jgi:hypothetical protein